MNVEVSSREYLLEVVRVVESTKRAPGLWASRVGTLSRSIAETNAYSEMEMGALRCANGYWGVLVMGKAKRSQGML